jgi:hypothetical protein
LEGGAYTNAKNESKDTCRVDGAIMGGGLNLVNRTFVVDEELGVANVFCRFADSATGMPDSHTFRLVAGRYRAIHTISVNLTGKPLEMPKEPPKE